MRNQLKLLFPWLIGLILCVTLGAWALVVTLFNQGILKFACMLPKSDSALKFLEIAHNPVTVLSTFVIGFGILGYLFLVWLALMKIFVPKFGTKLNKILTFFVKRT